MLISVQRPFCLPTFCCHLYGKISSTVSFRKNLKPSFIPRSRIIMSASNLTAAIRRQLMKDAVVLQDGGNNNNNIYSPLENHAASTKQPPKEKTLQCSLCPKRFASAPALSRHRREQHKLPPKKFYVCPLCKSSARNKAFYREHLLSEHQTTLDDEKLTFDSYNGSINLPPLI